MTGAALEVDTVSVSYRRPDGSMATVVSKVSLEPAAVVGLVGESGCGKSSLALAWMGATPDGGVITSGSVAVEDLDLLTAPPETLRAVGAPPCPRSAEPRHLAQPRRRLPRHRPR
ncbi:MAG: ATP-binding cassette domain-containing protein [Pseudonocardiaceae bacterium]